VNMHKLGIFGQNWVFGSFFRKDPGIKENCSKLLKGGLRAGDSKDDDPTLEKGLVPSSLGKTTTMNPKDNEQRLHS
jgi:hypothetical protein